MGFRGKGGGRLRNVDERQREGRKSGQNVKKDGGA